MATQTVETAAEALGISRQRVRKLCQDNGIGQMISPRLRLLTARDVERLRTIRRKPGRPKTAKA